VEKYSTARRATDDNTLRRMRFVCRIIKATDTHPEYVIHNVHRQQASAPQCYLYNMLPVMVSVFLPFRSRIWEGRSPSNARYIEILTCNLMFVLLLKYIISILLWVIY